MKEFCVLKNQFESLLKGGEFFWPDYKIEMNTNYVIIEEIIMPGSGGTVRAVTGRSVMIKVKHINYNKKSGFTVESEMITGTDIEVETIKPLTIEDKKDDIIC